MTAMVRAEIADIIRALSDARKEIKPEILYWLQTKFEKILELKPRYIDVLTLAECTKVRDLICAGYANCDLCILQDKMRKNGCLSHFMTSPYDSMGLQKYIDIAKKQIKERNENGTENS
jgi:hypothetical protein